MKYFCVILTLLILFPHTAFSFPFSVFKKETTDTAPILLITSGIHGDEPAAFSAAGIFVNHYTIQSGRVWIVPNLNFTSILLSSRGIAGDMNRKFLINNKSDPDYANLENIKSLINHKDVDFIYSMHDGSGFYRPNYISVLYSPYRWGQCVVIDQAKIAYDIPHAETQKIAQTIVDSINTKILSKNERYSVRNTKTQDGNNAMEQSLTWYAVKNKKASLGVEASKNIPLYKGVYYHLLALEAMLTYKGIEFTRTFPLTATGVKKALYNIDVKLFGRYSLPIENIRSQLHYVPFESSNISFTSSNPILYIYRKKNAYAVQYGNTVLSTIYPEFMEFNRDLSSVEVIVDGVPQAIQMGQVFSVKNNFLVSTIPGYRANVIGYVNPKQKNEFNCLVNKKNLNGAFSVDTKENVYRIELYKGKAFAGIVYAKF